MERLTLIAVLLLAILAAACSTAADADGPPEISYGRDICIECNMIISEPRFAASYRLEGGETKSFDGIGELIKHGQRTGELDTFTFAWVHDFNTEEWVLVEEAVFVVGRKIVTPMGHGIVAFAARAAAEQFASDMDGTVMTWPEVSALSVSEEGLLDHDHGSMADDDDGHEHDMDADAGNESAES